MRISVATLFLLAACASGGGGGSIVDASAGGAPFAWVGGGFTSGNPQLGTYRSSEEMAFLFENVSDRPQTAESLLVRQRGESNSPVRIDGATVKIGRMIDPGEELEVKAIVNVTPVQLDRGVPIGPQGLILDVLLKHGDGTSYRYSIQIPMARRIGIGP